MPFNLFRKKKPEEETPAATPQTEQPPAEAPSPVAAEEAKPEPEAPASEVPHESTMPPPEQPPQPTITAVEPPKEATEQPVEPKPEVAPAKTYLKAMPLRELSDLENVKTEVTNGNIIILKVTPLAQKSIEDVKNAVNDLYQFAEAIGGDIARLGEERIVICPKTVRIWREKSPKPASNSPLPTAA